MMLRSRQILQIALALSICFWACVSLPASAAESDTPKVVNNAKIYPDEPNTIEFPAVQAKLVRVAIHQTNSDSACIDELEIYGPAEEKKNLAAASAGAKASASSCIPGYLIHQIEHLNDGEYGNPKSWIANPSDHSPWAQIELPKKTEINQVVFSRDRFKVCRDRVPLELTVSVSENGKDWQEVCKFSGQEGSSTSSPKSQIRYESGILQQFPTEPAISSTESSLGSDLVVPRTNPAGFANLALNEKATASASSCFTGFKEHQIKHLNDGIAGNSNSWISAGEPSWAEIDLGATYWVYSVAFGSDSSGGYMDRTPDVFEIQTTTDAGENAEWTTAFNSSGQRPHQRTEFNFKPVEARRVRVKITSCPQSQVRIDEIEIYGDKNPIPQDKLPVIEEPETVTGSYAIELKKAFLGEEHAWLKVAGRADVEARLRHTPYPRQVHPRRVPDDILPLGRLETAPTLDGKLDDAAWKSASKGTVYIAKADDWKTGPLITQKAAACIVGEDLYLALENNRTLSRSLAVVGQPDGVGAGVITWTKDGLVFKQNEGKTTPLSGVFNPKTNQGEVKLPLSLFPNYAEKGIFVSLGMGGHWTVSGGHPIQFYVDDWTIVPEGNATDGNFQVRLTSLGEKEVTLKGSVPELKEITLAPGESKVVMIAAAASPIGPECKLTLCEKNGTPYRLDMFRYDPVGKTLTLFEEMIERFEADDLDVAVAKRQLAELKAKHTKAMSEPSDNEKLREAFLEARLAKRELILRSPELSELKRMVFTKRNPFHPSHNYSVLFDSPWRPGGGIWTVDIPIIDGRFTPEKASFQEIFNAGQEGVARTPCPSFDANQIYFAHRASYDDYYRIYVMNTDGSDVRRISPDGPFHDYWPTPLPDGDLAFITTRCKLKFLCWRPQANVLYRMRTDGTGLKRLSFANLTEFAPSVTEDGRILWTRSEYVDKGADYGHTLWYIRPDGTLPELTYGNTVVLPQGYANGREVPGTNEVSAVGISHFGDLNGPVLLMDQGLGPHDPEAINCITPEVPWPGYPAHSETFREPFPISPDLMLIAHAPASRFGLFLLDRYGNRELIYSDPTIDSVCPIPLKPRTVPPIMNSSLNPELASQNLGEFTLADAYRGLEGQVERGKAKYLQICRELPSPLDKLPDGTYKRDHDPFMEYYAGPVDVISGPYGWPSYVAKGVLGTVPIEEDGSASFKVPSGQVLFFELLDENFNEIQRMRSVVQLQPGERRSCIGCHEDRRSAPIRRISIAMQKKSRDITPPPWGAGPFWYEKVVQPVLDNKCISCHNATTPNKINLAGTLDQHYIPASYRNLIHSGTIHHFNYGYQAGVPSKAAPYTFGTFQSRLWQILKDENHKEVNLTEDQERAIKVWTDLNVPLWGDYTFRRERDQCRPQDTGRWDAHTRVE